MDSCQNRRFNSHSTVPLLFFCIFLTFRKIVHRKTEKKVTPVVFFCWCHRYVASCQLWFLLLFVAFPAVTLPSSLSKLRRCELFHFLIQGRQTLHGIYSAFGLQLNLALLFRRLFERSLEPPGHMNILPSIGIGLRIPWGWVGFFFWEYLDSLKVCNCFGTFQWK